MDNAIETFEQDVQSLRDHAVIRITSGNSEGTNLADFAHMCAAALRGEAWAVQRVADCLADITYEGRVSLTYAMVFEAKRVRRIVSSVDASRPDGAIAHASIEV